MSRLRAVGKNIKYNLLSQVITMAVYFALLPFIVERTGKEVYGVYLLVSTFLGYLGLLEFGFTGAVIKFVAELDAQKEYSKLGNMVSVSVTFYSLIGVLSMLALFCLPLFFHSLFAVSPSNSGIVLKLSLIAALSSLVLWPGRVFEWVLQGMQGYKWIFFGNVSAALLSGISALVLFSFSSDISYYFAATCFFNVLKYIFYFIVSGNYRESWKLKFPYFDVSVFRRIFDFSFYLFLCSLTNVVIFNLDNFVVGAFVGVSAVTLFSVAANLQNIFRMLNGLIGGPLFPLSAQMEGGSEYEKQRQLLLKGSRYVGLVFVPMVIITIVFCGALVNIWLGQSFEESVFPARVLLFFWIFNGPLSVGGGLLNAKGVIRPFFMIGLMNACLNLVLSILLAKKMGLAGVALGTTVSMVLLNFPLVAAKVSSVMGISLKEYLGCFLKGNILSYSTSFLVSYFVVSFAVPDNIFVLITEMGVVYFISLFLGYRFSLSEEQRKEIRAIAGV